MSSSSNGLNAVLNFTQSQNGIEIKCENGSLKIEFIGQTIRFWATHTSFGKDRSLSVVSKQRKNPTWKDQSDENVLRLVSPDHVTIEVRRLDTTINVWTASGIQMLADCKVEFLDGKSRITSKLHSEDSIFGGGLRNGTINQRGRHLEFWNSNDPAPEMKKRRAMYTCITFVTVQRVGASYGMFYDTVARADLACGHESFGHENMIFESCETNPKFYLIPGPSPAEVLDRYTDLTGRIELAPLWALHFGHSRYGIDTWEQLQHRVTCYRGRGMPLSLVYLDLDYMVDNKPWTWNEKTFRRIEWLLGWLKNKNIHVVLIMDPLIPEAEDYAPFAELLRMNGFCAAPDGSDARFKGYAGMSGLPDIFQQNVFNYIRDRFKSWTKKYGVSWWLDKTEPALCVDDTGEAHRVGLDNETLSENSVVHILNGEKVSHGELHNAFGMFFSQAAHDGQKKANKNRRPFVITRSGCAGSQRFGWTWTGDNYSDEGSLTNGIRQLINMGLSGWPLTGTNVGGFFGICNPSLWARWMQFGSFSPLFWSHSIDPRKIDKNAEPVDQTPWSYGENVRAISRGCLERRVRLLPHTKDLMWRAMLYGEPLMRPMSFDCWQRQLPNQDWIDLQYRWGDFLIAPITRINDTGRQVFLPSAETHRGSALWYDFFTGNSYNSGDSIYIDAPLERFPLLVPAGGIIPMWDFNMHTDGEQETLILNVWSGGVGKYVHYMDDGESLRYQKESTPKLTFDYQGDRRNGKLQIKLTDGKSAYESILVRLRMVDAPQAVLYNGNPVNFFEYRPEQGGSIDVMLSAIALEKGSVIEFVAK